MQVATIAGNLGRDAERKSLNSGDTVCEFSVAVSKKVKGEEQTTWWKCSIWGKRGDALAQYLTKGTKVACSGEMAVRQYTKQDGSAGVSVEMRVDQLDLMGGGQKRDSKNDSPPADNLAPF